MQWYHGPLATVIWLLLSGAASAAGAPLSLISGRIMTPSMNVLKAPASPSLSLKYSAPDELRQATFWFTSPLGEVYLFGTGPYSGASYPTAGTVTLQNGQQGLSLYAQPGVRTLTQIELQDGAANRTFYNASQLGLLFPAVTLTVTNSGTSDIVPPTTTSGRILTPTVSLSAKSSFFAANITGSDLLSGIYTVNVSVTGPGNAAPLPAHNTTSAPLKSGTVTAYWDMDYGGVTGTWTITGCSLCDEAGNCNVVTSAAAVCS